MSFTPEQQQEIHNKFYKALKGYVPIQDINFAASSIINDPSPENFDKVRKELSEVSISVGSGVATPDGQINNLVKNELLYIQSEVEEKTEEFIIENESCIEEEITEGNLVRFGRWIQSTGENAEPEPIEWWVLDVDSKNKRALLVTKMGFERHEWHDTAGVHPTWEECDLRTYCNNDFYNAAFNDVEKRNIVKVLNYNGPCPKEGVEVSSGNDTEDYVFIPSYYDLKDYESNTDIIRIKPTEYAKTYVLNKKGVYVTSAGYVYYYTRTAGQDDTYLTFRDPGGTNWYYTDTARNTVGNSERAIRYAVYVRVL